MEKSEYLYYAVKIVYTPMVQSTLAIENYFGNTIASFNKQSLDFYDEIFRYYEETKKHFVDLDAMDAALISYLRQIREVNLRHTLEYFVDHIICISHIKYSVLENFLKYQSDKNIKNPFQQLIIDIRILEDEINKGKEVSSLHKVDLVWYDEKTLVELRTNKNDEAYEDGELGGHLMQKNVSSDLSYLSTRAEREKLFREFVLGETSNAD